MKNNKIITHEGVVFFKFRNVNIPKENLYIRVPESMDHIQLSKELSMILGIEQGKDKMLAVVIFNNQAYLTTEVSGLNPDETVAIKRRSGGPSIAYTRQLARALGKGQAPLKRFVSCKGEVINGRQCFKFDMVWEFANTTLTTQDED